MYLLITITEFFLRSWQVLNLWGIPFKIHSSWIILFLFFSWTISNQVNLTSADIYTLGESWLIGFFTISLFLGTIIINQIVHTFVCIRQGMKIKNITFYFLGAILQTEKDCPNPIGNIRISLVRPSLYFFLFFILIYIISLSDSKDQIYINVLTRLSSLNLFLGLYNLLPVSSLDGGVLLRSIVWYLSGSKTKGRFFLNKLTSTLSLLTFILGLFSLFYISIYYGILLILLGLFGLNSARSDNQFLKIEKILMNNDIGSLKLKSLRRIEFDINFKDLNKLAQQNEDKRQKYYFITKNGRWIGFLTVDNLKDVPMRKWDKTLVSKYARPISEFPKQAEDRPLWKIIEALEETSEGILLIVNSLGIPKGLVDRNQIGYFVLKKLGINLSMEIFKNIKNRDDYPLGIELPKIIQIMKIKGDIK